MESIETFETGRLTADRLRDTHLTELCLISQNPQVMATLSADGSILSTEETDDRLNKELLHWESHGFGLWMFHDKSENRFVGRGGLRHVYVGGQFEVELSYALVSEFWGQGLATEMAGAIVNIGFEQLGLKEIVSFTLPSNRASQRVMEKAGFLYERDITHADLPHVLFRRAACE
jgi:ribosomal-protein-alanine N-acetyltransferase